jgi:hypothetical protein
MNAEIFLINDIEYTKDDILLSSDLQKQLLKQKRLDHHRNVCRVNAVSYRLKNKEKINKSNQMRFHEKYHNDETFRKKILDYHKNYREKRLCDVERKKRGRKCKFFLDDNLELVKI